MNMTKKDIILEVDIKVHGSILATVGISNELSDSSEDHLLATGQPCP
jgi:hypothetical protein